MAGAVLVHYRSCVSHGFLKKKEKGFPESFLIGILPTLMQSHPFLALQAVF